MDFSETSLCRSRQHCQLCRKRIAGKCWRQAVIGVYNVGGLDFACPAKLPWLSDEPTATDLRPFLRLKPMPPAAVREKHKADRMRAQGLKVLGKKALENVALVRGLITAEDPIALELAKADANEGRGCRGCRRGRLYMTVGAAIDKSPLYEDIKTVLDKLE